jgi:galactokinase
MLQSARAAWDRNGSAAEGRVIGELAAEFERRFGTPPRAGARAPGRVNLIGEHTDYSEGLVLPCAVDRDTVAWLALREDDACRAFSREEGGPVGFRSSALARTRGWVDYVQGVVFALREAGVRVPGFDLALASEVPPGAGLSSSAALQLAVVTALDAALQLDLQAAERARLAHRSETAFVRVACGIMDPFASALGRRGNALRLDCRSGESAQVPLPEPRLALLVAHSGVRRALSVGAYGRRVAECHQAFEAARRAGLAPPGGRSLRDLRPAQLPELERVLGDPLGRRVRHVVSENARVEAACQALRAGDAAAFGALLREGMRSLRDDYEVSIPELDALCELADALPGVYGSRLTGAGFGGCTLHAVEPGAAEEVAAALAAGFARRFGREPPVWRLAAAAGAAALAPPAG